MSHLKVLNPDETQNLNMSFMESTVKIDDNIYDIFEMTEEWQGKFLEFADSWSYTTSRMESDDAYLKVFFLADKK